MSRSAAVLRSLLLSCAAALLPATAGAHAPRALDERPLPSLPPQLAAALPAEASTPIEADPFALAAPIERLKLQAPPLNRGRFGLKTGLAIFKYANANPTTYIDPSGYAAFNTHDLGAFVEEVETYDPERGTVHKTLSDPQTGSVGRFGLPAGSKFQQSYAALVKQYGSREQALQVLKAMQGQGLGTFAVTILEKSDYTEGGALNEAEVYKQFIREVGSFADESIGDLRSFFLQSIAGAQAGEGRDISLEYNAGYATSMARGRAIAEPQMGSVPFYRFYKGNEVLRKLSIEGKMPRDVEQRAIDAHILTGLQVGTLGISAKSALSSLRGGIRGFAQGLRGAESGFEAGSAIGRGQQIFHEGTGTYVRGAEGEFVYAEGTLGTTPAARDLKAQAQLPGKLPGDHAGHPLAARFGFPGTDKALVPMAGRELNLSAYKSLENHLARLKAAGHDVAMEVWGVPGPNVQRPDRFFVMYTVDGKSATVLLRNPIPGGTK